VPNVRHFRSLKTTFIFIRDLIIQILIALTISKQTFNILDAKIGHQTINRQLKSNNARCNEVIYKTPLFAIYMLDIVCIDEEQR